ncbi:MAG: hypothetical protein R2759_16520 [Bacteroidales bacterium]
MKNFFNTVLGLTTSNTSIAEDKKDRKRYLLYQYPGGIGYCSRESYQWGSLFEAFLIYYLSPFI